MTPDIYQPDNGLAEGEINLADGLEDPEAEVIVFARQLLSKAATADWHWSSFAIEWSGKPRVGRVYGRAWCERDGSTVSFYRLQILNKAGDLVATGSGTAHKEV